MLNNRGSHGRSEHQSGRSPMHARMFWLSFAFDMAMSDRRGEQL